MSLSEVLNQQSFTKEDIVYLLSLKGDDAQKLFNRALEVKLANVGNSVHLRGLIEYSNLCRKDCMYCGIRRDVQDINRYTLTDHEVLECSDLAMELNYGSLAIQCGERQDASFIDKIAYLLKEIKTRHNGALGVTLSCGEQTEETYKLWQQAGAHRYLLRIEASNPELYYKIHPKDSTHSFEQRIEALKSLVSLGYQTGTGVMIGLPFQTTDNLAEDLMFFKRIGAVMIGMGPFIPSPCTPLYKYRDAIPSEQERMFMTLKMIATLRLFMPRCNMVAATADQTIEEDGREKAVLAGANIIMPNLTPNKYREDYMIYPNKACTQDSAKQCRGCLAMRMKSINHTIGYNEWGDSLLAKKQE